MSTVTGEPARAVSASTDNGGSSIKTVKSSLEDEDHVKGLEEIDPSLEFWKTKFHTLQPCVLTRLKPGVGSSTPSTLRLTSVDLEGISTKFQDFCERSNVTIETVFNVAWGMVLRTYTASDRVCFGYGTPKQEILMDGVATIKPQVNIFPYGMQFDRGATILDMVHKAESESIQAIPQQHTSIAQVHHQLGFGIDMLFNTSVLMWSDEDFHGDTSSKAALLTAIDTEDLRQYDIIVHVNFEGECFLSYWDHFISDEQATHLAGALGVVFTSIIEAPHRSVGQMEIFSHLDHQKLAQWNRKAPVASDSCLHDLISQRCLSQQESPAVVSWDGTLTYREVDRLSSSLAHQLHAVGVGPDVFVPVYSDRCKWVPVAMLSIIKAGGAFCALDPSYPPSRLVDICQALKSTVILTTANNVQKANRLAATVLVLGDDLWMENGHDGQGPRAPLSKVCPSNALYAVFTSGSTGTPKGIVIEHRSFSTTALASLGPLNIRSEDRILHFASYAFDLSIFEILTALTAGASVAIPSEDARLRDLPRAARELQATWTFLTPTVARLYRPEDFPLLQTLCLGGEVIHALDIGMWASKNLITGYNPAECCPLGVSGPVDQNAPTFLGWSFSSQSAWIVDPRDYQKLVPVGAIGELVIEGPAVARGYVHDPASSLPSSPFISPPPWLYRFRTNPSQATRLYRTGDLVQYGHDGAMHFIGRKDLQVKVRGQRIELAEIEFHLHKALIPFAAKVVVEVVDFTNRTTIVAFILSTEHEKAIHTNGPLELGEMTSEFEARVANAASELRNILPSYMVPSIYLPIKHIPISRSGKTDRMRLRSLALALPPETLDRIEGISTQGQAPATDIELRLQEIFSQVLELSPGRISADSDFFRLGGDSIRAMKLLALVLQNDLYSLTFQEVFHHPVLRDMASVLSSSVHVPSSNSEDSGPAPFALVQDADLLIKIASQQCGISEEDIEDIYPCTPLQTSLISATAHDKDAYVALQSFTLADDIDVTRLKMAWSIVSEHHQILRTRIIQTSSGSSYQIVVRGPVSFLEEQRGEGPFNPSIGIGTPLIHLCLVQDRLLAAMHHAMYDGWSLRLMIAEFDRAYRQIPLHRGPPFKSFVKHVEQSMDSAVSFWKAELQDANPVLFPELPFLNYKPEPRSSTVRSIALPIPIDDVQQNVTVATELQLAWAITCSIYTKSQDIIFGAVSSGRSATVLGIENILGPTLTTTPFRVLVDPLQGVREALEEVQYRSLEQLRYEHIGLQLIAQQGENAAAACRFQTMLVVEPNQPDETKSAWFSRHDFLSELTKFSSVSLMLRCQPTPSSVEVTAIFDPFVVPDTQMQRILSQFHHVLTQIRAVGSSNTTIGGISSLSPEDWDELKTWNQSFPPVKDACVHQIVQDKCQKQPGALAIHSWDGDLTYGELENRAGRLAGCLKLLGVGPDNIVAVYLEKSLWTVVAQLATLMAGAAFITLETSQPIDRLREICDTVQPIAVLTSKELWESGADLGVSVPLLIVNQQHSYEEVNSSPQPVRNRNVNPSDAMYSIATSGTTGKPKVVIIEHQAFLATSMRLIDRWDLNPESRVLQFAAYSFDAMVLEHFFTLLAGGCICIPSSFDRDNRLSMIMNEMCVNWTILTASVTPLLTPAAVPTLKTLVQGGEPMRQSIIDTWASHVRLFNAYGPAECSVCSCSTNVISPGARDPKNIGLATGGVCWIVDSELPESPPLAIGVEGELIIEGAMLARGYLSDPSPLRTATAFSPRPRWLNDLRGGGGENRIYRTGDIVKYNPDGSISYVRRKDSQVKLRGQRVELQEIEHHVQSCFPGALHVVADIITLPDTPSTVLVALVLTKSAQFPKISTLTTGWTAVDSNGVEERLDRCLLLPANDPHFIISAHTTELALQERIPSYMIPSLFIPVSHIPRDFNGKVNRREITKSLASLSRAEWDSYASADTIPPTTDLERTLQKIWARVLNIDPDVIGIHHSFFRLGGDSITCMQVAAQCGAAGIPITVKDIFKQRTIEKLAAEAAVIQHPEPQEAEILNPTEAESPWCDSDKLEEYVNRIKLQLEEDQVVEDIYPSSPIQRGILMSYARKPEDYEQAIQWKVASRARIDVDRLRSAWCEVVQRHAALRTVFFDVYGENYLDQVVLKNHSPTVLVYNGEEDSGKPTISSDARPMHYLEIKLSNTEEITIRLHINHVLIDGHSLFIIKRDLALAYQLRLASIPLPTPYRDYIAYLQRSASRQQSREYWKSHIEGTSPCLFPSLKDADSQDVVKSFDAFTLTLGTTAHLTQFCEKHRLALTSVFHVAWAIVVRRYTAMSEVCFGYMTSGRHVPVVGANDIVGPLFNMLVARVDLESDSTVLSIMQQYQDVFLASLEHQHQSLAETLHSIGSASGELFNTLVSIFNDTRESDTSRQPSTISLVGDDLQGRSEYPITLNILILADQIHMMLCYHTSLLSNSYARMVANTFCHVLTMVLAKPELRLDEIEVLDAEQRNAIYERNRTMVTTIDNCLHHTIHQFCLEFPDHPAVQAWDGCFSYRELDQLSSSLAEELIYHGVKMEMVIPVLLEKTRWTPVAIVAVLKSGASFVLMDASHPFPRLQGICESINPPLVIASLQTRPKASGLSPHVIEVSDKLFEKNKPEDEQLFWPRVPVKGSDAAYMVFTSGSTGKPKGVVLEHSCLATSLEDLQSRMHINPSSRALQFSSHAWDISVLEILLTLRAGACVCIPSDEERTGNLAHAANRMMVNWAVLTPTVARLVQPADFTHLETLILGGESISPADLATWHDKVCLIQGYGPAECTMASVVSDPLTLSSNPRGIGQPNGCVAWIVHRDNHQLLAPLGAIGELVLEGPVVGRGYINDPKASATAFIDPPLWLVGLRKGPTPDRLYKTGDLVRSSLDGTLIYVGRKDNQVKIRGQRVELGEVEILVSREFPGSHVVVELVKGSTSTILVAFILEKEKAHTQRRGHDNFLLPPSIPFLESVSAAVSSLRETMPSYMIPNLFLPLAYLPRAPTGKTERKLLRDHVASLSQAELEAYSTTNGTRRVPSTLLEAQLQEYVASVLHKSSNNVPLDEDLFTVGLDSLKAMALATSARENGLTISVPTIFQHPRLSELAVVLGQEQKLKQEQCPKSQPNPLMASADEICAQWQLDRSQVINIVPTTYYQRGFIASHHAVFLALHFLRPLDPTIFRTAFVAAVQKYAILRTAFIPFRETFVQLSLHDFDVPMKEIITDEDDPSVVTEAICREADKTPVSFGTPSTQLFLILGRASGRLSVVLRLLRAQFDGVTVSCIIADLRSAIDNAVPRLLPTLEYADFITSRLAYNSPSVFQVWRELLQGSSMTYLASPSDYALDIDRSHIELQAMSTRDIPMPDTYGGFTMATVVKAAWALCLSRKAQTQDVVFAQVVRNRHLAIPGIEHTAGPCLNCAPVRVPLRPSWTAKDLLQFVQRQQIQTMASDTADWDEVVVKSTSWPSGTDPGSAVHYLSAPVGSEYLFAGNIPCHFQLYDFKMTQTYPLVLCLPFPSEEDNTVTILRIVLTSAVFGLEVADQLLALFIDMVTQLTNHPDILVSKLLD
ncbi:lysergyl peptide synthetase subunit 1 [Hypoxylon sp. EC38]|nr:lysergyl peptide synthetase subunit 1 [Hypoxylon sp. EC38]